MINHEKLYALIGERVLRIREAQSPRMSQGELAKILDLKRTSITNIESGNQKITLDTVYAFCDRFGLPIQEVLPPLTDVQRVEESNSVVVGGQSHEVGAKLASSVARLRPVGRNRR